MSTSSCISTAKPSDDGIGQTPIAENNASRYRVMEATGDCNLSPTHKRNDSFNTCSLSAEVVDDDIGSFADQDDQSPSVFEAGQDEDEDEEPQIPQGVDRILTVDMFSRFATAYTYPIDGEYDDEYSSDDDEDDKSTGISKERISPHNDNELGENKYCRHNRNRCDTGLDGEKFIENQDDDDNDGDDALPYQYRRGHHRVNSLPWTMDETKDVSTPPSEDKTPVTPSPQKLIKKRAPAMLRNQRRSLSMSNTDLNGRYGDEAVPPSGARTPPRAPSLNTRATTGTEGIPHRRVISAHSPLSDMCASPKPPRPTCLSGGNSPRLRPRVGMPPRPSGQPITLSPQRSWSQPERTSQSFSAAPQNSGGPPAQHHFRTLSYENFKAMQDVSESVYLSQAFVGTSPDPSLLGSRPRHHTRSHSLDSRSTVMSTKSKDSAASEISLADLDAERIWNDYYEQKMVQKNYVKDELKYRLSKAMPKVFVKRLSLSSPPALKRANSAKFV